MDERVYSLASLFHKCKQKPLRGSNMKAFSSSPGQSKLANLGTLEKNRFRPGKEATSRRTHET